jgi:NAD+ synthase (glutamine-hydrolysing)
MYTNGFVKFSLISPELQVANPQYNIKSMLKALEGNISSIAVFPELGISAYSCGDLFFQKSLFIDTLEALRVFLANNVFPGIVVCGMPFEVEQLVLNIAIVIQKNLILGAIPKFYLPNTKEYYEKRWFNSGFDVVNRFQSVQILNQKVPFGNLIFDAGALKFGIEICEDMWATITPGNLLSVNGANTIINVSASNETLGKAEIRRNAVLEHSRKNSGAYIYVSAGPSESTSETVFSGHDIVARNGLLLAEREHFKMESEVLYADIDLERILHERRNTSSFRDSVLKYHIAYQIIPVVLPESDTFVFSRVQDKTPFVPKKDHEQNFTRISAIQEYGLAKRLHHLEIKNLLVGVSGGLDSSLALLVACRAFDILGLDRKGIIAVTMPGMHTSQRTKDNALGLMHSLGVTAKEISISKHVLEHLKLLGHDGVTQDLTYENAQARARTMVLMNLSNQFNGIVLGTGDLSEIALGWSTYNGDQMSMYNVNGGLPKTLVRYMIEAYSRYAFDESIRHHLDDILKTPISPELKQDQSTESTIGKYEINDYILFRFLVCGDPLPRIEFMVDNAFHLGAVETKKYVDNFAKRFYSQQFKRQASPDSPKVLDYALSPRSDWRMPSDVKR